jgi:thiosulfate/3-mercaptopyruvate sulfurtransferase
MPGISGALMEVKIFQTIIPTTELLRHLADPSWVAVDCRFSLAEPEHGRHDYQTGHIPGAVYAHLNQDLSSPVIPGRTGRHPLPDLDLFTGKLSAWGIDSDVQVIVYDDSGGAMAARLWWMLRWLGHSAVALLDGGWQAWLNSGNPVVAGAQPGGAIARPPRHFIPHPRPELLATVDQVQALRQDPAARVLDARNPERYRGEYEPIDPVAGHIPGAVSAPYADLINPDYSLKNIPEIQALYRPLLGQTDSGQVIGYCGSGVTSALNLIALLHAGFGEGRLYLGSWSEWITDPGRPIAKNEDHPLG